MDVSRLNEWEHAVRDDQTLSRDTVFTLFLLKSRGPNIHPGLVQFMKDARIKDRHTAAKYLKSARESGYVVRVHEGTHTGDADVYELSFPTGANNCTSVENPHQSLVGKNHTSTSVKKSPVTSVKKPHNKISIEDSNIDYKPAAASAASGSVKNSPADSGLGKNPSARALAIAPVGASAVAVTKPQDLAETPVPLDLDLSTPVPKSHVAARPASGWWSYGSEYRKAPRTPSGARWTRVEHPGTIAELNALGSSRVIRTGEGLSAA